MNQEPNSEAAEPVQIKEIPAVDLPRIVSESFAIDLWHYESSLGLVRSTKDQSVICAMPHALNKRAIKMRKPGDDAEITPEQRLIAAAPKMLHALQRIRDYQGRFGEDDPQSIAADVLEEIYSANAATHAPGANEKP